MYLESIFSFHKQFLTAFKETQKINLSEDIDEIREVVVSGMGGSAFGGRIVKSAFLDDKLLAPLDIAHRYELPVDENKKRHEDLKGEIKSKGFGFVELRGRFEGKDELQIQKKLTNK